ncbi:AbrB/MazE/SpoVT family DNA-binding domain-containing protein [Candidatus Woesearchaeota archaeon]|nr:AbrB/MazE/SpoVT family DNA-binding domain-containing protein [Candidatus Woesearchaeota archaeon]
MSIETVKMSSKGQVVIPQHIRESLQIDEGSILAVVENSESVILKKLKMPSKDDLIKELKIMASEGAKRAGKAGIEENDVPELVHGVRKRKR